MELLHEPHNTLILNLLFILCTWHASAKLHLHTTTTLRYLKEATRSLGFILQKWTKTCLAFDTRELPTEVNARTCWKAASSAGKSGKVKEKVTGKSSKGKGKQKDSDSTSRHQKLFNLCMYKLSALGEYTWAILQYGTTESYSTQTVCNLPYKFQFGLNK